MPWERWCVLGRLGDKEDFISLTDLGLEQGKEYLLYEFWSDTFLGVVTDTVRFGSIDPRFNCQLFCIRPLQPNPQVLATSRHISCGATDLSAVTWNKGSLSGTSNIVPGDEYTLIINEPAGYSTPVVTLTGGTLVSDKRDGTVRRIRMVSPDSKEFSWKIDYKSASTDN